MARIRRKSFNEIQGQAARIASRLSGGYMQPVNYTEGRLDVDRDIYDSPTARRNPRRIERVVATANRYIDNIAKINPKVDEHYRGREQYQGVQLAKNTKYPSTAYTGRQIINRNTSNASIAAKGNNGG